READARSQWQLREESLAAARIEADEAQARFDVLRETVGAQVETLLRQLADAREAVRAADAALRTAIEARQAAGEARASASARAEIAEHALDERSRQRAAAVERLRNFTRSSLLHSAV